MVADPCNPSTQALRYRDKEDQRFEVILSYILELSLIQGQPGLPEFCFIKYLGRQAESEFKASLVYGVSSKTAKAA